MILCVTFRYCCYYYSSLINIITIPILSFVITVYERAMGTNENVWLIFNTEMSVLYNENVCNLISNVFYSIFARALLAVNE